MDWTRLDNKSCVKFGRLYAYVLQPCCLSLDFKRRHKLQQAAHRGSAVGKASEHEEQYVAVALCFIFFAAVGFLVALMQIADCRTQDHEDHNVDAVAVIASATR